MSGFPSRLRPTVALARSGDCISWNPFAKKSAAAPPKDVFLGLRKKWLGGEMAALAGPEVGPNDVVAVVVEFARESGVVMFVAAQDGTASMYTSRGGGTIGMGFHASTAASALALVACANSLASRLPMVSSPKMPAAGNVAFHIATKAGTRSVELPDKEPLKDSLIVPLHLAGHHLVTSVRLLEEKTQSGTVPPQTIHVHVLSDSGVLLLTEGHPMPTLLSLADLATVLRLAKARGDQLQVSTRPGLTAAQAIVLKAIHATGLPQTTAASPSHLVFAKGGTTLHHAVDAARNDILEDLAKRGAPIDQTDSDGYTPLILAAFIGRTPALKTLVALGANVNAKDKDGNTPLMFAAQFGDPEAVEVLLAAGADIHARAKNGYTALKVANLCSQPSAAKVLAQRGATE